jgi:hypothetical protein
MSSPTAHKTSVHRHLTQELHHPAWLCEGSTPDQLHPHQHTRAGLNLNLIGLSCTHPCGCGNSRSSSSARSPVLIPRDREGHPLHNNDPSRPSQDQAGPLRTKHIQHPHPHTSTHSRWFEFHHGVVSRRHIHIHPIERLLWPSTEACCEKWLHQSRRSTQCGGGCRPYLLQRGRILTLATTPHTTSTRSRRDRRVRARLV